MILGENVIVISDNKKKSDLKYETFSLIINI